MTDEAQLLREFAINGSEDAFAALVQHFLPLVYGAALRRTGGDTHRAQDVSQLVFTALARNAAGLAKHPNLTAWLFTTTRFLAAKAVRAEQRRQVRETAAMLSHGPMSCDESADAAAPLGRMLDDVMMELRELDRQIILLRFHRGLRFAEIGAQLGATENAVQKRLDRALEALKEKLSHRGITSTAAAIAAAFEQQSAIALPTGLAAAATTAGLTCGAGASGALALSTFMVVSKVQVGVIAALVIGSSATLVWQVREHALLRAEGAAQVTAHDATVRNLNQQLHALSQRAAAAEAAAAALGQTTRAASSQNDAASTGDRVLVTSKEEFDAIMRQAAKLERQAKHQDALQLYLDCYRSLSGHQAGIWRQFVMSEIERMGGSFLPALDALRALRDAAIEKVHAGDTSRDLVAEAAELNQRLGDAPSSMMLYDSLSPNDSRRQTVALIAFDVFVDARRYADAIVGKSYATMVRELEMDTRFEARMNKGSLANHRPNVVSQTTRAIEALAGVGQVDEAKSLAEKLLVLDSSDATRAAITEHLDRARPRTAP